MNEMCIYCDKLPSGSCRRWTLTDRRKGLQGSWNLVECDHCGIISIMPLPTDDQLSEYYSHYYNKNAVIDLSENIGSRYPRLRKLFHYLSGNVDPRDFVSVPPLGKVLDFGCGQAGYLSDFHRRGINISGAEISESVVNTCKSAGYDVHKVDDFLNIPFKDAEFDVVYLMQVFEHLRDPNRFMEELARVLKVGGELYLAVPNSASFWRKFFGDNWVSGWFAPFHLFHYNKSSLSTLGKRFGLKQINSWSNTPIMWFRLNVKARLYREENRLDGRRSFVDNIFVSLIMMLFLRLIELPIRERDCLVVRFKKIS